MPDTSKMTPEEYKAFVEGQATGHTPERTLDAAELRELIKMRERMTMKSMSEKFWDDRIDENVKERLAAQKTQDTPILELLAHYLKERLAPKKPPFHSPEEWDAELMRLEETAERRRVAHVMACGIKWDEPKSQGENTTPADSPCRDGQGLVSHDYLGDKCIKCGKSQGESMSEPTKGVFKSAELPEYGPYGNLADLNEAVASKPTVQIKQLSQEQFEPGQTVCGKAKPLETAKVLAVQEMPLGETALWVNDGSPGCTGFKTWFGCKVEVVPDKPAEPAPQKCPDCGESAKAYETEETAQGRWFCACSQGVCTMMGPKRPTRLEAIQAWNSIRVIDLANPIYKINWPHETIKAKPREFTKEATREPR